jgi:hypothetical protein
VRNDRYLASASFIEIRSIESYLAGESGASEIPWSEGRIIAVTQLVTVTYSNTIVRMIVIVRVIVLKCFTSNTIMRVIVIVLKCVT